MGKSPAFQIYPGDLLSSPRVAVMTTEQLGAYLILLFYAWLDADCSIPDDDSQLAAMTKLGEGWFNHASRVVRPCFEPHPRLEGRLVNVRLVEERVKQLEWREKSAAGGRKSAQTRRAKALELLRGGATTPQPPLADCSTQTPTNQPHSGLQFSVSKKEVPKEQTRVPDHELFSPNGENPADRKKASAKNNDRADAPKDPLCSEKDDVAHWLAEFTEGLATPESRARLTGKQIIAIRAEAKRLRETCNVSRLEKFKEWYAASWYGIQDKKKNQLPSLGFARSKWGQAFPDDDPHATGDEPPVEGSFA